MRALEVLKTVDCILAEDTRHTSKLLNHYHINTPLLSLYEHNEQAVTPDIIDKIKQNKTFALVSDAGTPLISDPGFLLVSCAKKQGISVIPIPGASAVIAALSASGIASNNWTFHGFLPHKKTAKKTIITQCSYQHNTQIFYESPKRVLDTIIMMKTILGNERIVCLAKEISKQFETIMTSTLDKIKIWLEADERHCLGEFVIIMSGKSASEQDSLAKLVEIAPVLMQYTSPSIAAKIATKLTGLDKKICYQFMLKQNNEL